MSITVILASEESHLHLFEHIALPVDLPAAALKLAHRSEVVASSGNDRF
jgi:hypothetical protein